MAKVQIQHFECEMASRQAKGENAVKACVAPDGSVQHS